MSRVAVVIPAAGKSSRFGGQDKKPFLSLDGRPIWLRSAELFWTRSDVTTVYLVVAPDDRDDFRARFGHLIAFANLKIIDGGEERFDSVANALAAIPDSVEFVAVHDAVRPLATATVIDAVFAAAFLNGAALPAIPVADTLKRVEEKTSRIADTIPRAGLWQAQTPQVFRRDWLAEAYAQRAAVKSPITDDAQLIEMMGHPIVVVSGSVTNFKITTKDDLDLAAAVLKSRERKPDARPTLGFDDEAKW